MKAFPCGKSDKRPYRITPYKVKGINARGDYVYTDDYSGDETVTRQFIEIPCGHCAGCRADQAKEWSDRLIMESKYCDPDSMYFITLTYDEEHLKRVGYVDKFGEVIDALKSNRGTLDKRDIQLFIKRLRAQRPDDRLRYYICGEYGPQTDRPHCHGIIYGLHLRDWKLVESGKSETGNTYYTCGELERIWGNGFVSIEPANEFTCKYVAQYVTKKIGAKPAQARLERGQVPEFSLMSRRPGIGRQYFEDKGDEMFDKEKIFLATLNGSVEIKPPRYFKKLYKNVHEDRYSERVKKLLQRSEDVEDAKTTVTDLDKEKQLLAEESNFSKKLGLRNKI